LGETQERKVREGSDVNPQAQKTNNTPQTKGEIQKKKKKKTVGKKRLARKD